MSYYSPELIRQIVDASDIVDVISQYVPLKRKGKNYVACCPFHNEKTPSFSVDPDKKFFYCFGCHEGGDVIKFLQKKENFSFPEAVKYLADRVHIDLPRYEKYNQKEAIEKNAIYNLNKKAGNYFYNNLKNSQKALGYLVDRGITHDVIFEFGLGYSKESWTDLKDFLLNKDTDITLLKQTGLVRNSKDRDYDLFRDRLMIPIQNVYNQVIAFGARKLSDTDTGPKYINSPDSLVFNKRRELFNLNRAKQETREKPLILVEGYMDVIALYSYGIKNVAAALGTAFTKEHAQLISRYAKSVTLCFDGDQAGKKATDKALDILSQSDLKINIVRLPAEHDPDSYIRANELEAFNKQLDKALSVTEYKIKSLEEKYDLKQSKNVIDFISDCLPILVKLNPVEQEITVKNISELTGIEIQTIQNQLRQYNPNPQYVQQVRPQPKPQWKKQNKPQPQKKRRKVPTELVEAQNILLAYATKDYDFLRSIDITDEYLIGRFYKWLFLKLKTLGKNDPVFSDLITSEEDQDYSESLSRFLNGQKVYTKLLAEQAVEVIKKNYRNQQIKRLEAQLRSDEKNKQQIFEKIKSLREEDWKK